MNNKTNTNQGTNVEHLFANSILDHPKAFSKILNALHMNGLATGAEVVIEPKVIGNAHRKTDVEINVGSDIPAIRINIKSFGTTGYNHVERRSLLDFCRRNQISTEDHEFLKKIWLRKASYSKRQLIDRSERERIKKIFSPVSPGESALLGNDHPQILALYRKEESRFNIYDMATQVMPLLRGKVGFSVRASNIQIGDYIVIQRKGSAAGEAGTDIMDISHRANDVQIKMRVLKFYREVEPLAWYAF